MIFAILPSPQVFIKVTKNSFQSAQHLTRRSRDLHLTFTRHSRDFSSVLIAAISGIHSDLIRGMFDIYSTQVRRGFDGQRSGIEQWLNMPRIIHEADANKNDLCCCF